MVAEGPVPIKRLLKCSEGRLRRPPRSFPPRLRAAATARDYSSPVRIGESEDPPSLEAALVTQLSGDFPGPVLAVVSVPFYSADRQRILVPRGARILGTAQAVSNQDQSRLAVSFHRLILPDGRWISLDFQGLNQAGEGALKDQVNRHYFSMFAAVGAVGVLGGLTAARGNPYEGGVAGFRAGHRLRVWFTSDVLVPRPQPRRLK